MKHHKKHGEPEQGDQPKQESGVTPPVSPTEETAPAQQVGPQELDDLRRQVEALQKERDDLFARLQRLSADYANYQKRTARQVADSVAYEKERLLRTLLPICDNFELTIQKTHSGQNADMVLAGVRIVYDQILDVLRSHGVEPIKASNETFDPVLHEALMQRCDPEKADNLIVEECQRGYLLAGKVLRPSKVIVNKTPALGSEPVPEPTEQPQAEPSETPGPGQEPTCEE